eukprot:CAMPEP_0181196444 /NCGR_PEP_ID=MMETSP1096-20121128/15471_1 /TAXON_ID=156174 ORGANISM="Chrysochromulina ericina, Strain CCMP281" /NCGR_SAMPLE_ID=MMETSP1096 /ASSEMBLY_ACC=CAM_ASM_000453 /LENGTH=63 /DNA_ID=CAMNT_0023286209 /DNA_START=80 /DNA_END=268 /DNA_ORIENTATION=+
MTAAIISMDGSPTSRPDSPNSAQAETRPFQTLYFCKFPSCNKGYASTDGVRKHCRKHHSVWLA